MRQQGGVHQHEGQKVWGQQGRECQGGVLQADTQQVGTQQGGRGQSGSPCADVGFQGMTAQQSLLGAYIMAGLEQQLQEAVTRAVVMAMATARGPLGWPGVEEGVQRGTGLATVPPS